MGSCGCGDFSGDLRFPAPDGDTYVIDVYYGCDYCGQPAGIIVHRFTPDEAARWGIESADRLDVTQDGIGIPVVDPEILRRLMVKEVAPNKEWVGEDDPADLCKETIADGLRAHFRDAAWKTYADWKKHRRALAVREGDGRETRGPGEEEPCGS